jgi:hypothetical protein
MDYRGNGYADYNRKTAVASRNVTLNLSKQLKMQMFATPEKWNTDRKNTRSLNLVAVKHTVVQVTRLLL